MGHLVTILEKNRNIVLDGFNRPDSASLGSANTGQAWSVISGTAEIVGNQAHVSSVTTDRAIANVDTGNRNCEVEVTFSVIGLDMFLAFRIQDLNNFWMLQQDVAGQYNLFKRNAGAFTAMGTFTGTVANGDVLRAVLAGNSIRVYINGTERMNVNDSHLATMTKHGFGKRTIGTERFDNFRVVSL